MSALHILVDADACPVVRQVEDATRRHALPMTLLCDEHHLMHSDYAQVRHVSSGADAVDIALMNLCRRYLVPLSTPFTLLDITFEKQIFYFPIRHNIAFLLCISATLQKNFKARKHIVTLLYTNQINSTLINLKNL